MRGSVPQRLLKPVYPVEVVRDRRMIAWWLASGGRLSQLRPLRAPDFVLGGCLGGCLDGCLYA